MTLIPLPLLNYSIRAPQSDVLTFVKDLPINQPIQATFIKQNNTARILLDATREIRVPLPQGSEVPEKPSPVQFTILATIPKLKIRIDLLKGNLIPTKNSMNKNVSTQTKTASTKPETTKPALALPVTNVFINKSSSNFKDGILTLVDSRVSKAEALLATSTKQISSTIKGTEIKGTEVKTQSNTIKPEQVSKNLESTSVGQAVKIISEKKTITTSKNNITTFSTSKTDKKYFVNGLTPKSPGTPKIDLKSIRNIPTSKPDSILTNSLKNETTIKSTSNSYRNKTNTSLTQTVKTGNTAASAGVKSNSVKQDISSNTKPAQDFTIPTKNKNNDVFLKTSIKTALTPNKQSSQLIKTNTPIFSQGIKTVSSTTETTKSSPKHSTAQDILISKQTDINKTALSKEILNTVINKITSGDKSLSAENTLTSLSRSNSAQSTNKAITNTKTEASQLIQSKNKSQYQTTSTISNTSILKGLTILAEQLTPLTNNHELQFIHKMVNKLINQNKPMHFDKTNKPAEIDSTSKTVKSQIQNQGLLWENKLSVLSEHLLTKSSTLSSTVVRQILDKDPKGQLLKIIQAIPFLIERQLPDVYKTNPLTEVEIAQVIFKIQQLLASANKLKKSSQSQKNSPDSLINWLAQTVKLTTQWISQIEHSQQELSNQQSNQQPISLHLQLPVSEKSPIKSLTLDIKEEENSKSDKSKPWKWSIKLNFDFGENRLLTASTKIGKDKLLVQFSGDKYFETKMHQYNLQKLAEKLDEKTGLESTIEFTSISKQSIYIDDGIHLEI